MPKKKTSYVTKLTKELARERIGSPRPTKTIAPKKRRLIDQLAHEALIAWCLDELKR